MTKKKISDLVALKCEMTKKHAEIVTNAVFDAIMEGVQADGKVQITDFITITAKQIDARIGRNPQTGAEIKIPRRYQLFAKFGKGFKDLVNGVPKTLSTSGSTPKISKKKKK